MVDYVARINEQAGTPNTRKNRFIICHADDFGGLMDVLDPHVANRYGPIAYDVYRFEIGGQPVVAVCSTDPKFYFGIRENSVLHKKVANLIVGDGHGSGVNARTIEQAANMMPKLMQIREQWGNTQASAAPEAQSTGKGMAGRAEAIAPGLLVSEGQIGATKRGPDWHSKD